MRSSACKIIVIAWLTLCKCHIADAQNLDTRLARNFNSENTRYDGFWLGLNNSVTPVSLAAPVFIFSLAHFKKDKEQKWQAIAAGGALVINSGLTIGLKWSIGRPRPFEQDALIYQKTSAGTPSFPSGHTSLAFATATSLTLAYPKWYVAIPAYAWATAAGYSRMHLGVHYPSDVLSGAILGSLSSYLTYKLNKRIRKNKLSKS